MTDCTVGQYVSNRPWFEEDRRCTPCAARRTAVSVTNAPMCNTSFVETRRATAGYHDLNVPLHDGAIAGSERDLVFTTSPQLPPPLSIDSTTLAIVGTAQNTSNSSYDVYVYDTYTNSATAKVATVYLQIDPPIVNEGSVQIARVGVEFIGTIPKVCMHLACVCLPRNHVIASDWGIMYRLRYETSLVLFQTGCKLMRVVR